jgi:hypothetical protein
VKREEIVKKITEDYCLLCTHYKKPQKGYNKKKFEITCEEHQRLRGYIYHKEIILNYIDVKSLSCSNFRRDFK